MTTAIEAAAARASSMGEATSIVRRKTHTRVSLHTARADTSSEIISKASGVGSKARPDARVEEDRRGL